MGPESASSSKLQLNSRTTRTAPTRSQHAPRNPLPNSVPIFPDKIKQRWRKEEATLRNLREKKRERKVEKDRQREERREASAAASGGEELTLPEELSEDEDEDEIRSYYASPAPVDSDKLDPRTKKRRRIWRDPLSAEVETGQSVSRSISPSVVSAALRAKAEQKSDISEIDEAQPSTDLLKFIHNFASEYYTSRGCLSSQPASKQKSQQKLKGKQKSDIAEIDSGVHDDEGDGEAVGKDKKRSKGERHSNPDMYRLFDGSALMAIGMLLQEYVVGLIDGESEPPETWLREMGYIEDEDHRSKRRRRKKDEDTAPAPSSPEKQPDQVPLSSPQRFGHESERESRKKDNEEQNDDDEAGANGDKVRGDDTEKEDEEPDEDQNQDSISGADDDDDENEATSESLGEQERREIEEDEEVEYGGDVEEEAEAKVERWRTATRS